MSEAEILETIANFLDLTTTTSMVGMASINYMARALSFRSEMMQFRPDDYYLPGWALTMSIAVYAVVMVTGTVGAVYFMMTLRKRGDE